ncbi:MAG: insulinase family protein [Gemmatimonadaceae bacterium]|nr:insulinase family protein [Gemmatimonadaceae bacterium]
MRHSEMRRAGARLAMGALGAVLLAGAAWAPAMEGAAPRRERAPGAAPSALHDPALTMGTLPNGMRYYLRVNKAPKHRVELRLAVNAGSLLEDDDQQGFAHFLEHMAFNGTAHFPRNTLIDFIETSGMRFGADLNAYTSQDETVYMLTLPSDDATVLGKGLDVLQDWASGAITIDSAEVVAERGVVMGEWRMRALVDSQSARVRAHYDTVFYGGSRYFRRKPIGDTALIAHAEAGPIKRFYHDWYRPDLMAVVVVGDFDPVAMQREIERRFGSIPAREKPRRKPADSLGASREPAVDVYRGPVIPRAEVLWPVPAAPADAKAAVRQRLVTELLTQELEERLLAIRSHPSRPFITTELERGRLVRPIDLVGVELIAWPDSLERGLVTVVGEIERIARNGIPKARLAHRKAVLLAHLEHAAASASARSSKAYADAYVQHYLTGEGSLLSAQQELALAREILPTLTPRALAEAARFWRKPAGERVYIALPELAHVRPPTRESILALFDSVAHAPLPPDSVSTVADGELMATLLPTPGKIVGEKYDSAAGITEWTLSNGARVLVKPTQNDPDEVLLKAWSPGGFSAMPDSLFFTPGRMAAHVLTDVGGVDSTRHDALADKLATTGVRAMRVGIGFADESIDLAGSPRALETLFQLLHRQFTAPMLDSATLAGWQSVAKYQVHDVSIDDQLNQLLAGGNPRLMPVQTQIAELATLEQLLAVHRNRFGNAGDFTFTLVGAVTPKEVRPLVERYLASLPSTTKRETPKGEDVKPFLHRVNSILPRLPMPKAVTFLVFDGPFPSAPNEYLRERQRLSALTTVLQDRLRVRLREELAGTYSPFIRSETLALPDEHYRVLIAFDAAPERMHQLNLALMKLLDTVRTKGVTAAEAARAATIQHRQLETRLQSNAYWLNAIVQYHRLGIPLDRIPSPYPEQEVAPAELQAAARQYLPDDVFLHVTMMPEDSTSYAHDTST